MGIQEFVNEQLSDASAIYKVVELENNMGVIVLTDKRLSAMVHIPQSMSGNQIHETAGVAYKGSPTDVSSIDIYPETYQVPTGKLKRKKDVYLMVINLKDNTQVPIVVPSASLKYAIEFKKIFEQHW